MEQLYTVRRAEPGAALREVQSSPSRAAADKSYEDGLRQVRRTGGRIQLVCWHHGAWRILSACTVASASRPRPETAGRE